jgi:hypothetical protein
MIKNRKNWKFSKILKNLNFQKFLKLEITNNSKKILVNVQKLKKLENF